MEGFFLLGGVYLLTDISVFEQIINLITGSHEDAILGAYIIPRNLISNYTPPSPRLNSIS